jgi:hypothetical protein
MTMKARLFYLAALGAAVVVPVRSMSAQCASASTPVRQACTASVDLVNYMTPQLATAIAAGSSTLGQSGALGGVGRFAISLRATGVLNGAFPNIDEKPFRTDGQPQSYTTKNQIVPGLGVDFSMGLTKGASLGATNVGGLDLLVSALYLPNVEGENSGDFSIKATDGNLKLGYGLRLGLLDESLVTPGLYLSYLQRDLPPITISGSSGTTATPIGTTQGTFALNQLTVKTTAIRLVASKNFVVLGLQAGIGQDTYKGAASIQANAAGQQATGTASMSMTRTNMFGGVSINLLAAKLVLEYGQVMGGTLAPTSNTFDKAADASRTYLSGGIRIAF